MIPRVAVVEDEEALSVLLRYNLEAEGFEVDTILRGDEAEIRLQERTPDLLILDWMLPGVSGIELCRRLRMRRLRPLPMRPRASQPHRPMWLAQRGPQPGPFHPRTCSLSRAWLSTFPSRGLPRNATSATV